MITRRGRGDGSADEIEQSDAAPALRAYGGGSSIPVVANTLSASMGHHGHSSPRGDGSDNLIVDLQGITSKANRSTEQSIAPTMSPGQRMVTYAIQERAVSENLSSGPGGTGIQEDLAYTLEARHHTQGVVSIQDGRGMEKAQNGLGISTDGVGYTLDGTGAQGVYVPEVVPNAMSSKWAKGAGGPAGDEIQNVVAPYGRPRRLMPIECLRLQGFPDTWHDLQWSHADADEADALEILRCLWRSTYTWAREGWGSGEPPAIFTPEVLLAGVHGGWLSWALADQCAARARALQGSNAWPEGFMRELRQAGENRPPPHRRESFEQLARELGRPLSELPLTEAQALQAMLSRGMPTEASSEWPVRPSRSTTEARSATAPLADTHRYKQLGNAVAVPVARWIGERIVAASND